MLRPTHLLILVAASHVAFALFPVPDPFPWPIFFYEARPDQEKKVVDAASRFGEKNNKVSKRNLIEVTRKLFKDDLEKLIEIQRGFIRKLRSLKPSADADDIRQGAEWIRKYIEETRFLSEE